jgi:phosphatidylserine decarboxylase
VSKDIKYIKIIEGVFSFLCLMGWIYLSWDGFILFGAIVFLLFIFTLFFFRDPFRRIPEGERRIISPADGKIVEITDVLMPYFKIQAKRISIFLSLWDVHINRIPISGKIINLNYMPGRYYPAFSSKASSMNEQLTLGIKGKHGSIILKQIAGVIARRIVCNCQLGDKVTKGERFGMIKFGSRVEVYLPLSFNLCVNIGDHVKSGESIIGELNHDL